MELQAAKWKKDHLLNMKKFRLPITVIFAGKIKIQIIYRFTITNILKGKKGKTTYEMYAQTQAFIPIWIIHFL